MPTFPPSHPTTASPGVIAPMVPGPSIRVPRTLQYSTMSMMSWIGTDSTQATRLGTPASAASFDGGQERPPGHEYHAEIHRALGCDGVGHRIVHWMPYTSVPAFARAGPGDDLVP